VVERIPTAIVLERVRGDQVARITAWVARVGIGRTSAAGGCELVHYIVHGSTAGGALDALRREVERGEEGWIWR
ncbi:MAG: hypothetical protein KA002_03100, partial [Firmicutes bacterium]|nr:hypothetical protein [Bacillota bacterium]